MAHSGGIAVQVIKITIQGIAVKLDGDDLLSGGISDSERFLQTFKHPFAILMRELIKRSVSLGFYHAGA